MPPRRQNQRFAIPFRVLACALAAVAPALATAQTPALSIVAPTRLRQGDPVLAWVIADAPAADAPAAEAELVNAAGKVVLRSRCFPAAAMIGADTGFFGLLMALPPALPPGSYRLAVGGATADVAVEARVFPLETIRLDETNARIRTVPSKRKDDEARRLHSILTKVDGGAVIAGPSAFLFPVEGGRQSAGFGDVRRYVLPKGGSERSVHEGIDWAVVAGTVVRACARGKVLLTANREVTGKTVVIEHLPGLYSLYCHLSAIDVAEGSVVERGGRIALSGSSGMSTGPHLHWEMRAMGEAVDPGYWLKTAILDKDAVLAIISGLIEGR